jgi:hypothetical protein
MFGAISLVVTGMTPQVMAAQESTPVAGSSGVEIVASALTSPRGMVWGSDGTLFVALAGSGGPNDPTESAPTNNAVGLFHGGPTAAVVQIDAMGCPVLVAGGLPSAVESLGGVLGAEDLAILNDQLYVSVDGGGPVHGNADQPSGVYRILADGSSELVADLSAWVRANPVAEIPGDLDPDAAGYSIVADEVNGLLWVGDPNSGQILSVTPAGEVARIADLSVGHPVPTKLALDPGGGVFVGTLTAVPFADGAAKVMHVTLDGTVTDFWTGLTAVTSVAVGPDGSLYAVEMSTGNLPEPPFFTPASGRVVRQTGPDSLEVIADGLMLPESVDVGPDGALYVSMPAIGASGGEGMIGRIAVDGSSGSTPMAGASMACSPIPETLSASTPAPAASPANMGTPAPAAEITPVPPAATPTMDMGMVGTMTVEVGTSEIGITDFAFDPTTVEIEMGTTVTWTNNDDVPHTATGLAGEFDTGTIGPGESASFTFDTPGTYTYYCEIHPSMQGTIIVK